MGAWGTAIFSDDLAADVRGDWRDLILDGAETEEAAQKILKQYKAAQKDEDEGTVFWLALAAAQMETGRLQDAVRDRALKLIELGGDLSRWEQDNPGQVKARRKALEKLAEKLKGPQSAPKKLRRQKPLGVLFEVGDAILIRASEGDRKAIGVVVEHAETYPKGTFAPVIDLVYWREDAPIPSADELARLPSLLSKDDLRKIPIPRLLVVSTYKKDQVFSDDDGEVIARGINRKAPQEAQPSYTSWPNVRRYVGGSWHERNLDLTASSKQRRRLFGRG